MALVALAGASAPPRAWAHAALLRSAPLARSASSRPPERVQLWFSERIERAYARLTVEDATGARVDRADLHVPPGDPTSLAVRLLPLAPGDYTVRYRVLSVDGHVVEGRFTFTIRAPARPGSSGPPGPSRNAAYMLDNTGRSGSRPGGPPPVHTGGALPGPFLVLCALSMVTSAPDWRVDGFALPAFAIAVSTAQHFGGRPSV